MGSILSLLYISLHLFCPYYIHPCIYSLLIIYIPAFILSILHISLHLFSQYYIYIPAFILSILYISLHLFCPYYIYPCIYSLLIIRPLQSKGMSIHLPLSVSIRRRP